MVVPRVKARSAFDWADEVPKGSPVVLPHELPVGAVMVNQASHIEHTGTGWQVDGEPSTWQAVLTLLLLAAAAGDDQLFRMDTTVRRCAADDCAEQFIPVATTGMKQVYHHKRCEMRHGRRTGKWK